LNKLADYSNLDPDIIGNNNVLIYAPFEAAFAPANERAIIIENLNNSKLKFQVTSLVNQDASLSALFDMTKYGFVVLATHGAGGSIFLTGEIADTTQQIWQNSYKVLYTSGQIGISGRLLIGKNGSVERKEKVYYAKSTFISNLAGKFPNSVILNNSCEGTKTAALENAFIGKGAKAYYGYNKVVGSGFCVTIADSISKRLAIDFKNTAEAYLNWSDPGSENAQFQFKKGANDVHFALRLINGDFEFGNLDGWTIEGDGRNISKLAYINPPQGNYMGIISTGLGFTTTTGSIFQSIRVEENQSNISLKWNFLSEEFLEFINSSFQDFFKVTIIDEFGNEDVLIDKSIDVIANEFGAQKFTNMEGEVPQPGSLKGVSPEITFDRGDVYMTDWQTYTFDITNYRGDIITIVISAGDVGDSIYDTAILLDEVTVN
ncbi:MAG: choice-of-anchor L domain-containing protein, partial [Melioribacteraceae bacterium]|nr:choice-of-anchor L domain-containing protein [Melioribacteraceae bacterium]